MKKGSFTVEAAVILWITMMILYGFVCLSFCLHDRLLLYETALHTASGLILRIEEPVSADGRLEIVRLENRSILRINGYEDDIDTEEATEVFLRTVRDRLLISEPEEVTVTADGTGTEIRYTAVMNLPFNRLLRSFLPDSDHIEKCIRMERRPDPEEIVRMTGGLFRRK